MYFRYKKKQIYFEIDQVQNDGYYFEMPLEIGLVFDDKNLYKIETINLEKSNRRYYISSEYKPIDIIIDPNTKLLARWNFDKIN